MDSDKRINETEEQYRQRMSPKGSEGRRIGESEADHLARVKKDLDARQQQLSEDNQRRGSRRVDGRPNEGGASMDQTKAELDREARADADRPSK